MSRAYRLKVSESCQRIIRGTDHVSTQLEILDVLPRETMAGLLAQELIGIEFEQSGEVLIREQGDVKVTINPSTGVVQAEVILEHEVELKAIHEGTYFDETEENDRKTLKSKLKDAAKDDLEQQSSRREKQITEEATEKLSSALNDLSSELNRVLNKVTANALKEKAKQLGRIKEMTENEETGSMTIVLEV